MPQISCHLPENAVFPPISDAQAYEVSTEGKG